MDLLRVISHLRLSTTSRAQSMTAEIWPYLILFHFWSMHSATFCFVLLLAHSEIGTMWFQEFNRISMFCGAVSVLPFCPIQATPNLHGGCIPGCCVRWWSTYSISLPHPVMPPPLVRPHSFHFRVCGNEHVHGHACFERVQNIIGLHC